jgi:uncharacterized protein
MKSVHFLISPNCNLRCKYCYQLEGIPQEPSALDYHSQSRTKATAAVIDSFAEFCHKNSVEEVVVFGGEPLFYPDLFQHLVESLYARVTGIEVGAFTNGTLITEEIMRLFERLPISVLLSLDGGRERHDRMRGGFDRISRWFDRLAGLQRVRVAVQAGEVVGLYDNVSFIWSLGLRDVYVNVLESYGWYAPSDVLQFEQEYERIIQGMLSGQGEIRCALALHEMLKQSVQRHECGITGEGLACDWHGLLYPCHKAMEIGPQLAIGDIYKGLDEDLSRKIRALISEKAYGSPDAAKFPLVSFCPISTYQKHGHFGGEWNKEFCELINRKAKLVSKYHYEIEEYQGRKNKRASPVLELGAKAVHPRFAS